MVYPVITPLVMIGVATAWIPVLISGGDTVTVVAEV
jgi:hypothetical protein